MTTLTWNDTIEKRYETGVRRGVFYPKSGLAEVWDGLVSVVEGFVGGEQTPRYYDGVKYIDLQTSRNYKANLVTFSTPPSFGPCLGDVSARPGFIITRQPKTIFDFSYQTLIGDDIGYKIHLIYNASVVPGSKSYASLSDTPSAPTMDWTINAVPIFSEIHKPSAHFIVDSTKVDPYVMVDFEGLLYGSDTKTPEMFNPTEIASILGNVITEPLSEPV